MKKGKLIGIGLVLVFVFYVLKTPEAASYSVASFLEMLGRWGSNIAHFVSSTFDKIN